MKLPEILSFIVLASYGIFMAVNISVLLFRKKKRVLNGSFLPTKKISILISFRNEELNILKCLESIVQQNFQMELFELVLIDDHSTDLSNQKATNFLNGTNISFQIINLADFNISGKKNAIQKGVELSTGEIIITRDADTFTDNRRWLRDISFHFETENPDLLILPVVLNGDSFLQNFQRFENIAVSGCSYAMTEIKMPFVCSGANLAYKKSAFLSANPYKDNLEISSGDDMFLLEAFIKKGFNIQSLQETETIVYTVAENTFKDLFHQRLRWISKGKHLTIKASWLTGLLMVLSNLWLFFLLIITVIDSSYFQFCLFAFIFKCIIDFLLVFLGSRMYKQKMPWLYFLPSFLLNIFYTPFISVSSFFIKSSWKQRNINL